MGLRSAVRRAMAAARESFSCTGNFNHRGYVGHRGRQDFTTEDTRTQSERSCLRNRVRLPLPFVVEIDHLADVVLDVCRTLQDHVEASVCGSCRRPSILPTSLRAIARGWFRRTIATASSKRFRASSFDGGFGIVEFARAVADVAGLRDLRADVVVQVAGQVQDEVAEAVAEGEGLLPELGVGERRGEFVDAGGVGGVATEENGCKWSFEFGILSPIRGLRCSVIRPLASRCRAAPGGQPRAAVPT